MSYNHGCVCHGATFCPDLICIGYEDDVPVFVSKDSPEGREAVKRTVAKIDLEIRNHTSAIERLTREREGLASKP